MAVMKAAGGTDVMAFATTSGTGMVSPIGVTPRYEEQESIRQFRSWVYNCASRNAVMIANAPLRLYAVRSRGESLPKHAPYRRLSALSQRHLQHRVRKAVDSHVSRRWANGGEVIEITEHPFLDLMRQVNPFRNQFDHMEETSIFSDCSGNAYWYIVKGRGMLAGIPAELWLLPSQYVTIIPDKEKFIKGYLFGGQNSRVALTPDEVVHFRRPNMRNQYYGMGRIEAAYNEVSALNWIAELESDRARTHGIQDLHFQVKNGDLTETQKNDYAYQFENAFNRNRRNPVPLISGSEVDIKNIAWSPKDLLAAGSRGFNQQCVINAFGQSTALWNDAANRATVEAAIYQLCKFETDPTLIRFAQKCNEQIIPLYDAGDRLFCAFDQQAQDDREFALRQEVADRSANLRTINEIRKERDLDPDPDPRADDLFAGGPVPMVEDMAAV